jgi:hypothetical protein
MIDHIGCTNLIHFIFVILYTLGYTVFECCNRELVVCCVRYVAAIATIPCLALAPHLDTESTATKITDIRLSFQ